MLALKENEVLVLPKNQQHTCPQCGLWARGAHDIDRVFGFRRHSYAPRKDGTIRVDVMPWCKTCRSYPDKLTNRQVKSEAEQFNQVRGKYPGVVYLIFAPDIMLCKIGYSQTHPSGRLRTFQCGSPVELMLVGFYGSDYFGETEAHRANDDSRVRGEWFAMNAKEAVKWIHDHKGLVCLQLETEA